MGVLLKKEKQSNNKNLRITYTSIDLFVLNFYRQIFDVKFNHFWVVPGMLTGTTMRIFV